MCSEITEPQTFIPHERTIRLFDYVVFSEMIIIMSKIHL